MHVWQHYGLARRFPDWCASFDAAHRDCASERPKGLGGLPPRSRQHDENGSPRNVPGVQFGPADLGLPAFSGRELLVPGSSLSNVVHSSTGCTSRTLGQDLRFPRYSLSGRFSETMGSKWSHSVAGSPQYAHRTSAASISSTRSTDRISSSVGSTTGMIELTKEFVIVDVRPVILTGRGIRKALRAAFGISKT